MIELLKDRITGKAPPGAKRSRKWRAVRKAHLEQFPSCAVCGDTKKLEVHHRIPFWAAPGLELAPSNLITLCRKSSRVKNMACHRIWGHLGDYQRVNEAVASDAAQWRAKFGAPS